MMHSNNSAWLLMIWLTTAMGVGTIRADTTNHLVFVDGDRVAFLGDSITKFGWVHPAGWIHLIDTALQEQYVKIEVIPAGISGNKSHQMLKRLDADVLAHEPDWLVLSCGVNDVAHGKNGVPLDAYRTNITAIVEQAQAKGVKVLILTATMIHEVPDNAENRMLAGYNEFLRTLVAEKGCRLADLNADMQTLVVEHRKQLGEQPYYNLLTGDGVHMMAAGDVMMASGVLRAIGFDEAMIANARAMWMDLPARMGNRFPMKLSYQLAIEALPPEKRRAFQIEVDNETGVIMEKIFDRFDRSDAIAPFEAETNQ